MISPGFKHLTDPVHLLALGFGSGLAPRAPGTAGTLVGVALDLALRPAGFYPRVAICVVFFIFGIWLCGASAQRLGVHDHPAIVWDEIVGIMLVMLIVPLHWPWIVAAFLLFRVFDIWKPWPIRELDHSIPGGLGIMLDDVLAAGFTAAILAVLQHFLH